MTRRYAILPVLAASAMAQNKVPEDRRNFIACPIVRDTKTVPCFLAEYEGELYYLGVQEDIGAPWFPPQQSHEVLVEGTVKAGPRVCGGIPLSALVTSVMPELTRSCNTVLPARDDIPAPADVFRGPGPGPSTRPRETSAESSPPFIVYFDFDNDQMRESATHIVRSAVSLAAVNHATHFEVTVSRGAVLLSNGRTVAENEFIATRRADKIAAQLKGLGVPPAALAIKIDNAAATPTGLNDHTNRRALISVAP